ncbi:hypothetical protein G7077_10170 [Sphingomonas piscis]|uniref:Uncharacterized protein n=1 Tax=Sphingomonas piscis TaxID=2714943 RepID=A0A6G7YR43_9SPHN|nr:hypothetical protein [Sphingomonas piscis]QIK79206.1 hypothetical protein G7077_10170 [Sphingomonas piscis]
MAGIGALLIVAAAAGIGDAVPPPVAVRPFVTTARSSAHFRMPRFQQEEQPGLPFIAAVPVTSSAVVGIGRFHAQPRRRLAAQDLPIALEPRKARRAAVGLSLRF